MTQALLAPPILLDSQRRPPIPVQVPQLSVVIVNYCQWRNTAALVRQLLAEPSAQRGDVEVVVVDNHSPPHPLLPRLRRWPGVSLRRWRRNHGFGRAANEGCRLSRGNWLLLLNPDVSVSAGFLQAVLTQIRRLEAEDPRAGIIGLQLRNPDGSRQFSAGVLPTLANTLTGLALPRARRKYRPLRTHKRCRVPWVSGCGLLARRDCWQDLGGFDPRYFLYYEDVDLCRRARERGWSVWFEPAIRVVHQRPLHSRNVPALLRLLTRHALLTYSARHWPWWQFRILAGIITVETWWRRCWAGWRGDAQAVQQFSRLGTIIADLVRGRRRTARRRLEDAVGMLPRTKRT